MGNLLLYELRSAMRSLPEEINFASRLSGEELFVAAQSQKISRRQSLVTTRAASEMLNLKSESSERWLKQVDENLKTILIDHAHCEQKAASTAMNLMFDYVEHAELRQEMSEIVQEELEHFQMVTDILDARNIRFYKLKPGTYGRKLKDLCRRQEPEKAVDRLLVAGLIEARSCERFALLRDHLKETEPELSQFFGSLFESEARHHATYSRLARLFQPDDQVKQRLEELAKLEAAIIEEGCELPRVHS